jgi:hypothetical protein
MLVRANLREHSNSPRWLDCPVVGRYLGYDGSPREKAASAGCHLEGTAPHPSLWRLPSRCRIHPLLCGTIELGMGTTDRGVCSFAGGARDELRSYACARGDCQAGEGTELPVVHPLRLPACGIAQSGALSRVRGALRPSDAALDVGTLVVLPKNLEEKVTTATNRFRLT